MRFGLPNITSLMQISEDLSSMRSLAKARGYERSRQETVEGGGGVRKKKKCRSLRANFRAYIASSRDNLRIINPF